MNLEFPGKTLGKVKKGALIRSHDDEKEKFALGCPCRVCFKVINIFELKQEII